MIRLIVQGLLRRGSVLLRLREVRRRLLRLLLLCFGRSFSLSLSQGAGLRLRLRLDLEPQLVCLRLRLGLGLGLGLRCRCLGLSLRCGGCPGRRCRCRWACRRLHRVQRGGGEVPLGGGRVEQRCQQREDEEHACLLVPHLVRSCSYPDYSGVEYRPLDLQTSNFMECFINIESGIDRSISFTTRSIAM